MREIAFSSFIDDLSIANCVNPIHICSYLCDYTGCILSNFNQPSFCMVNIHLLDILVEKTYPLQNLLLAKAYIAFFGMV